MVILAKIFSVRSRRVVSEGSFMTSLLIVRTQAFLPFGILRYYGCSSIQPNFAFRFASEGRNFSHDLAPVTGFTLDLSYEKFLGTPSSHRLTGGVYKARERIHGGVADPPLLAIPSSWSRIADSNLN